MSATARRVLLLAPPLAFAAFEVIHPRPDVNAQAVMEVATWFAAFHAIQLVLLGLVAISVPILADELGAARAWSTRLGMGVFLIFFSAYDAIAGIATGLAMRTARDLPAAQQEGVWETVKDWPGWDPPRVRDQHRRHAWLGRRPRRHCADRAASRRRAERVGLHRRSQACS